MEKLKILYAASTASHLRRFHQPYIQRLKQKHDVRLMATEGEGIDFPIHFAKSFFSLGNLREILHIRKILKQETFDRVIVHTTLAAFLIRAAMIGMRNRPYVLNVVHGYLFSKPVKGMRAKILLLCEKLVRRQTDAIAVMNREDLELAKQYRLTNGKMTFLFGMGIPSFDAIPAPEPSLRAAYAAEGELLCSFVGELSARKNQIFLVRAFAKLRREGLPVRLLLLGDGSMRETLEQEISNLDAKDFVTLAGNREPILPYLAVTDVYVSASTSEGLPFNVMEAMSCGLPIVASDTKGQNDLLEQTTAILYPLDDEDAFCDAIRMLHASGIRGVGSCSYENLRAYCLSEVFEDNMKVLLEGANETTSR
ncbi:MAG: glycosyltransferase [Clostridia bacterium]|nr:glycosyltransferase [Clostridia bacterium]